MNSKAILGLDTAQAGVVYHLQTPSGRLLAKGHAAASLAGWQSLTAVLTHHHLTWPDCLIGVEATGQLHLPWCERIQAAGGVLRVLNPLVAKRTTPVSNAIRDHKSDPVDAARLAHTLAREHADLERFAYRQEPARAGLRKLLSARASVRAALTNLLKSAGAMQWLVFPELRSLAGVSVARQRALLAQAPTAAAVAALPAAQLRELVGEPHAQVRQAARESFAPAALAGAMGPALQTLLGAIVDLEQRLKAFDRQITAQARTALPAATLAAAQTLPGFGPRTTPVILACIPDSLLDPARSCRQKANAIQALFGFDPRLRQSGQWRGQTKISKRGIMPGRTAMFQTAFCALRHDPGLKAFYDHLRARGKAHKPALIDVMRILLRRLVSRLHHLPQSPPCPA